MNEQITNWYSYFYPETIDEAGNGVLRNIPNIKDGDILKEYEYKRTHKRQLQLLTRRDIIPQTFDLEHLKAIHAYLFQDVYEWAGKLRKVDIYKKFSSFASLTGYRPEIYMGDVHKIITSTPWKNLDTTAIAETLAIIFAYVNQAHPFREGNGRASKIFMLDVAYCAGMTLDYSLINKAEWNNASMLSGPDLGSYPPVPDSLYPIFKTILKPLPYHVLTPDDVKNTLNEKLGGIRERNSTLKNPSVNLDRKHGNML
ncbi:Fic/DOC family protein [Actinotignum urinale]|nr:Fic family protein [Actinotignum urinale]MDY5129881.1 Fic family protein [Actinotignum urinale]MDY5159503.1 Fic family protein [Actinotignum urinale]